jgi:hypothetical protein
LTSNQVQNAGVAVLSETTIFDGRDSFPEMITERFREITFRTLPYEQAYRNFFNDIEANSEDAIRRMIQCDKYLMEDFEYEAREDLDRARQCVAAA